MPSTTPEIPHTKRRLLLLGLLTLPTLPTAAYADATDLMAITNPATVDARPTLRVSATGFAADDFTPAHRIADTWGHTLGMPEPISPILVMEPLTDSPRTRLPFISP